MIKRLLFMLLICSSIQAKQVILWDLHKVVLQRSIQKTACSILSTCMLEALWNLDWNQITQFIGLGISHCFHSHSAEEYIHLAHTCGNQPLVETLVHIINAQSITPGIASLVHELDSLGIEQHIGSNIGKTPFNALLAQPEFAPVFSVMQLNKSKVVEYDPEYVVKKPDPLFFTQYLTKNNLDPTQDTIIFIDDNKENIKTARSLGLTAIYFRNTDQLCQDLMQQGVKVRPRMKLRRFEAYKPLFARSSQLLKL